MTVREAISDVRTGLKKIGADIKLFNKEIFIKLAKHIDWLVERDSNSFKLARKNSIFQPYSCIEVIKVPKIDPCCNIVNNCTIMRSKHRIPEIYEDVAGIIVKSLTSVDESTDIQYTSKSGFKSKKNNPWAPKDEKYWFYEDGYVYGDLPKKIKIVALFKEDISDLRDCDNTPKTCKAYLDKELIAPNTLLAQAIDYTIKDLIPSTQIPTQEKVDKNENQP